jgi:hypothetical protein
MAQFDPSEKTVDEVLAKLEKADSEERQRILNEERQGKARKTILEEYGVDPDERVDAAGRVMYPWEATGEQRADFDRQPEETAEERKAREEQAAADARVAAASPQAGVTPAGTGTAPAAPAGGVAGAAGTAPAPGNTTATGATGTR